MNTLHTFAQLAAAAATLASAPLVLELGVLSVAALTAHKRYDEEATSFPLYILVPAHNETVSITRCVSSLLTAAQGHAHIIVLAHNCTDNTAQLAEAAGATVWPLNDSGEHGKGGALHYGFQRALAEGAQAVAVVDADSTVSSNFTTALAHAFTHGAQAVQTRYTVSNASEDHRTRLLALSFLGINVTRPLGRHQLGLSCGIFGNGFALSAATLRAVPYTAHSVVEDLEYHLLLVEHDLRVCFLNHASVYGEMPNNTSAAATQRARWEGGRSQMRRIYIPKLLRGVLRGRLRLLEPLLDQCALPIVNTALLLLFCLALPLHWSRLYALTGLAIMLLHVAVSASLSPSPAATLAALATVPRHIFFKITRIASRRKDAQTSWVRTRRNAE